MTDVEWHDWRQGGIGGSDIAALAGLSRYASPTSLYYEKLGLLDRSETTPRQRIGQRMEGVLAEEFHDATGLHLTGEQTWCEHPNHEWARCTVDGFASDWATDPATGGDLEALLGTVQLKTDGRFAWPDGIPANIRAQCIWEMGVTGLRHCWLVVMFAGFRVEVFELDWDFDVAADWDYMFKTARAFWHDHVLAGVPPPVDDSQATTDALGDVHAPTGALLEANDAGCRLVAEFLEARWLVKSAQIVESRLGNELRAALGEHTDLVDGWTDTRRGPKANVIASWRPEQRRRVDLDALRAAEPMLVERCTKTTTTRVLRVPSPKENDADNDGP